MEIQLKLQVRNIQCEMNAAFDPSTTLMKKLHDEIQPCAFVAQPDFFAQFNYRTRTHAKMIL